MQLRPTLRHTADRRTLFWAFVLFPLLPVTSYLRPALALWLLPFGLYLAYCAGVLAHNHNHCPVFRDKRLNIWYSAWLSFFYGCPLFVWVPTHNQNHHRFLDGPGDLTQTAVHAPKDTLWAALLYPSRSALAQLPAILRFVRASRSEHPTRFERIALETASVVLGHLSLYGATLHYYGPARGTWLYALAVGIPAGFAAWSMMFTNYLQHVGCEHASPDDHSRNFVSRWLNWLVFDAGYHTVHHERPGDHWSTYAQLHEARAGRIAPRLNQSTMLSHCWKTYIARTGRSVRETGRSSECVSPAAQ